MGLFDRFRSTEINDENVYDEPKEKRETETMPIVRSFTEYRIVIDYGDRTRTEYVTEYTDGTHTMKLYEQEPRIISRYQSRSRIKNIPGHYVPRMALDSGEPLIISLHNVEDVEIEQSDEWVFVCEEVEYTQVYRQYKEDGEWQELYTEFEPDDEYEIRQWHPSEWEAESED